MDMNLGESIRELASHTRGSLERSVQPFNRSSLSQKSNKLSHNEVFSLILEEVKVIGGQLEDLERQYNQSHLSRRTPTLRSASSTNENDYADVLNRKAQFVQTLTSAVDTAGFSDALKYKISCYQEMLNVLRARSNEGKRDIIQNTDLLAKNKNESTELDAQIGAFSRLVEKEPEYLEIKDFEEAGVQFSEAKQDLKKLLNILYPDEEEQSNLVEVLEQLIDAYINNLDDENNQYAIIAPKYFNNRGLRPLIQGCVVIPHPSDSNKFRFCIGD